MAVGFLGYDNICMRLPGPGSILRSAEYDSSQAAICWMQIIFTIPETYT
jgi:hypothetical protein